MVEIAYAGFNMQSEVTGVHTTALNVYDGPARQLQTAGLAMQDGEVIIESLYRAKVILAEGYMLAASGEALETLIDTFKTNLNKKQRGLVISNGGENRVYTSTPSRISIGRPPGGASMASFAVEFYVPSGVGEAEESTTLATDTITTATDSVPVNVLGSYRANPLITLTYNSLTGGTSKTVSVTNSATQLGVSITRTWVAGDVLEIDTLNKTVRVDGVDVEFDGQLPYWVPGNAAIDYNDDMTTRNVDLIATYTKRYI